MSEKLNHITCIYSPIFWPNGKAKCRQLNFSTNKSLHVIPRYDEIRSVYVNNSLIFTYHVSMLPLR